MIKEKALNMDIVISETCVIKNITALANSNTLLVCWDVYRKKKWGRGHTIVVETYYKKGSGRGSLLSQLHGVAPKIGYSATYPIKREHYNEIARQIHTQIDT